MPARKQRTNSPKSRQIQTALHALRELGMPPELLNDRSALSLLALLGLRPKDGWAAASAPLCRITQMMEFFAEQYGVSYAPNTRETVRRFTMHQFVQAGVAISNPDRPDRPTNSPHWCYQVTPEHLALFRTMGTTKWDEALSDLKRRRGTLAEQYAGERRSLRIPVKVDHETTVTLSPGGQNPLIRAIVEEFAPRHIPGARLLYLGDSASKWAHCDHARLRGIGVTVESRGKMPDVLLLDEKRGWLVVVEAVTSHGPVGPKRRQELRKLLGDSTAGLVFVTAFPDRRTLNRYLADIAWETEVWCADSPTHLIHFNGDRFLGPH